MGFFKRSMMAVAAIGAAGTIVAGGTVPALAATTSGVRYVVVQDARITGSNNTECDAIVLSASLSTGKPAYVSAIVANSLKGACTGWLQRSVNGGAWKNASSKKSTPGGWSNGAWFKTANYYAGPGTRIRACIQSGSKTTCSGAVSLAKSSAKPANDATPVYYSQGDAVVTTSAGECVGVSNSSTKSKASTSRANLIIESFDSSCTGWLESSSNKGKTWGQSTPTYSVTASGVQFAVSSGVADGTGHLARACVKVGSAAKKCSAAW